MSRHNDDWWLWFYLLSRDSDESPENNDGCGCFGLLVIVAIIVLFFS